MLRIPCPWCGLRDYTEYTYGKDATLSRPNDDDTDLEAWNRYVYQRENPRGSHREYWHHLHGCRQWIIVERNTLTHQITGSFPASADPPEKQDHQDPSQ